MAKNRTVRQVEEDLRNIEYEAQLTQALANSSEADDDQIVLSSAASRLRGLAKAKEKQLAVLIEPIYVVPANATRHEVRQARVRQAVRSGEEVYLPAWANASVAFPRLFVRCNLFQADLPSHRPDYERQLLSSPGDIRLTYTGPALDITDRKYFAACLAHYRDRPLDRTSPQWSGVSTTFSQLCATLGVSYGRAVHVALRKSLVRLSRVQLHIRNSTSGREVTLPHLLEVRFAAGYDQRDDSQLKGADTVEFRLTEPFAQLYGRNAWFPAPLVALRDYRGYTALWLPFLLAQGNTWTWKTSAMVDMFGETRPLKEFLRRTRDALATLQQPDTPPSLRVDRYLVTATEMTVRMCCWADRKLEGADAWAKRHIRAAEARLETPEVLAMAQARAEAVARKKTLRSERHIRDYGKQRVKAPDADPEDR